MDAPRFNVETSGLSSRRPCGISTFPRCKLNDVVTEEGVQEFLAQIAGAKPVDVGGVPRTWWRATRMMRSPRRSSSFSSTTSVRPFPIAEHLERCFGRLDRSIRFGRFSDGSREIRRAIAGLDGAGQE
jgi:hypothetical protein